MRLARQLLVFVVATVALVAAAPDAQAISPRNPYRSFNLSGVNYGSMQWERAQRQGKRVWPSSNTPSRSYYRGGAVSVGGVGGAVIQGSGSRSSPRTSGRFRR
jgi:hypothetical protein